MKKEDEMPFARIFESVDEAGLDLKLADLHAVLGMRKDEVGGPAALVIRNKVLFLGAAL